MKKSTKSITLLLNLAIFIFLVTPYVKPQTVIGNSVFPFNEEDTFVWRCVNSTGPKHNIDDLTRFTVESIYNETFRSVHCLMVNYSIDKYDVIKGQWIRNQDNLFYLAYNKTESFLNWSAIAYNDANVYLVPTPVNLTLIGNAVESAGFWNYTFEDDMITFDYGNGTTVELTIDSQGVSKTIESFNLTKTVYRWELDEDNIVVIIPMGDHFLYFMFISIAVILLYTKKKMIKTSSQSCL
ncbi:MAG: hypothetical protein EU533_06755 [Promethearchaeota archaeon]|nr:MAG: hypothetical protein EU533_06755 [Candidatus Lokiarchaeota archaeon]